MASKAWPPRYFWARMQRFSEEAAAHLASTSTTIPEALQKGMEAYRQQLTTVVLLTGAAMVPTLQEGTNLLTRLHPKIYNGDVVAFRSPLSAPDQQNVLVRRVAAVEGDEMVSDEPEEEGFRIPQGHCWVLADNEELRHTDIIDSRTFGPLPVSHILGRAIYYSRAKGMDHGEVANSPEAAAADKPVLEVELNFDQLKE